jgi:hypothetical protein
MEEKDDIHNKLIALYIIIVVVITIFATWIVLSKAMPLAAKNNGRMDATAGLTIIEPDLIDLRGKNGIQ